MLENIISEADDDCPNCKRWTDQGPEYHNGKFRWECCECGDGPEEWFDSNGPPQLAGEHWRNWCKQIRANRECLYQEDNTPRSVKNVLKSPGIYRFGGVFHYWLFEVSNNGTVYVLNPHTLSRDNVLAPDKWTSNANNGDVTKIFETRENDDSR
jgi:hypothetical protein